MIDFVKSLYLRCGSVVQFPDIDILVGCVRSMTLLAISVEAAKDRISPEEYILQQLNDETSWIHRLEGDFVHARAFVYN